MAIRTFVAELALMCVIICVAVATDRRCFVNIGVLCVAVIATGLLVRSFKSEFCILVMIELDLGPFCRAVARFTFLAEPVGMNILKQVAADASRRQIFISTGPVTIGAFDLFMRALQRKIGRVMVKRRHILPPCRLVTCFTFLAERAIMGVIVFVAINTG